MTVKIIETTDEFIILESTEDGVPPKRTSVHIDSIADGVTTLDEQIALIDEDTKVRAKRIKEMHKAIKAMKKT